MVAQVRMDQFQLFMITVVFKHFTTIYVEGIHYMCMQSHFKQYTWLSSRGKQSFMRKVITLIYSILSGIIGLAFIFGIMKTKIYVTS